MRKLLPANQLLVHTIVFAVTLAGLAKLLDWPLFLPTAGVLTAGYFYLLERRKRARYSRIVEKAKSSRIEGFPVLRSSLSRPIDDIMMESLTEVTAELEKKCYQLVEKNIQLLSLKEISLTIISSLSESRIVDSVHSFLSKGLGFKEILIGIHMPEEQGFKIYAFRQAFGDTSQQEEFVPLADLNGLVRKCVLNRKSILIRDPEMHPLGTLDGTPLFDDSTMQSYLLVPMIKSKFSSSCNSVADCVLKTQTVPAADSPEQTVSVCPACGKLPVLGLVGVTDGFKAASLSQVDLVAVETLALQISTLLENAQLYDELQTEERFRENVINSMMNGLITVDTNGSILLANETAETLTGYRTEELKGMNINNLIIDNQTEGGIGPFDRTTRERLTAYQAEAWVVRKDGQRMPIQLNTSFLLDDQKRVQGALGVFNDLTRIKRMEEKIQHLDKLAALGRFSSSMAHEIRNPLTGIVAGIEYLRRIGTIPDDQSENISFILKEVNRIDRLITDILNVVRPGQLVYHPVHIESIITAAITGMKEPALAKSVRIKAKFPVHTRTVMIDSDRITQVVLNLLKNAIEASSEGGKVEVRVSFPVSVDDVLFDGNQNLVIIEVEDQGHGFEPDDKGKIFEPFFTTKPDGSGLGLYVTHSIVEQHGGYIFVDGDKGKGSTFTIYLPVEKVPHGDTNEIRHPLGR